jgi:hypothetical protein
VREIYRNEGLGAFYKGVLPNMILVTNPIVNFVIYENIKKTMLERKFSLNMLQLLAISSFAKTIATVLTYPVLTVRVNMQKKSGSTALGPSEIPKSEKDKISAI